MADKIKFIGDGNADNKGRVCLVGCISDYTLCGATMDGDLNTEGDYIGAPKEKINCDQCISIIALCKSVSKKHY